MYFISSGAMVSSIALTSASLETKSRSKLYGNLHVQNSRNVIVIIDTKHCFVQACDSFNNHDESFTNTMILMHKWIAKLMSIIDHNFNKSNQDKNTLFGSEDVFG